VHASLLAELGKPTLHLLAELRKPRVHLLAELRKPRVHLLAELRHFLAELKLVGPEVVQSAVEIINPFGRLNQFAHRSES